MATAERLIQCGFSSHAPMEQRYEQKTTTIRNEYTVVLHGARGFYFMRVDEWRDGR